jgi:hypothetical protein
MGHARPMHPLCTRQIACEGDYYVKTNRGMCGKCEAALAKREAIKKRQSKMLKGEHYVTYTETREK